MQLEKDARFNQWSRRLAKSHAVESQPIVYVRIQKLKPLQSRIEAGAPKGGVKQISLEPFVVARGQHRPYRPPQSSFPGHRAQSSHQCLSILLVIDDPPAQWPCHAFFYYREKKKIKDKDLTPTVLT
jgi:hypothetical protein